MRHKIINKPPVVSKFADYLKKEHKLKYEKDFIQLSKEKLFDLVDKYFEYQRNVKKLSESTLEKHISVLNKILPPVRPETREFFTPDNRAKWRDGVAKLEGDRYNNPDKIVENLKNIGEVYEAIAQLQRLTDARIGDVNRMQIDEENQRVYFPRSKGGRDRYVYFEHFKEDFEKVKHYKEVLDKALEEKSFSDIRKNEYYRALEHACEKPESLIMVHIPLDMRLYREGTKLSHNSRKKNKKTITVRFLKTEVKVKANRKGPKQC